ncbi:uncharacterized protein LOC143154791 [Ptiloglossa arizonensis]|uniref:uncharacterized protein LOC143154791 n=1 Tax=Ptiloglossa arizonensis TaxID=3350558 RepID=UPI003FA02141
MVTEYVNPNGVKDWTTVSTVQIVTFIFFVCGIFFAIIMYCKVCMSVCRTSNIRYSEHSECQSEHNNENRNTCVSQYYTIYESRDRPPPYNEACSAPPLYGSPFNRAAMLDAPPVYPETPKPIDRMSHPTDSAFSIVHHL